MNLPLLQRCAILLLLTPGAALAAGDKLYWTDSVRPVGDCKIRRSDLDGTNGAVRVSGLMDVRGCAIDAVHGRIYWAEPGSALIRSARLDGTDQRDVVAVTDSTGGVAVDPSGGKLYWTESGYNGQSPKIRRADLGGQNPQDLVTSGIVHPVGIALDPVGGQMYWCDAGALLLQQANLDGSNVQVIVPTTVGSPMGIAIDVAGRKLYWTEIPQPLPSNGTIRCADLSGSGACDLFVGLTSPTSIALDLSNGNIYWTETWDLGNPRIMLGDLNGTSSQPIVSGLGLPWGIAIGPDTLPYTYCTAKVNSLGCIPTIGYTGEPSQSGPDNFYVTASNVLNNKSGMLIWSGAQANSSFYGGTLCVASPIFRTPIQNSAGNPSPDDCSGGYSFHFSHAYVSSHFLAPGSTVCAQYWSRDPGFVGTDRVGLTDGLQFVIWD